MRIRRRTTSAGVVLLTALALLLTPIAPAFAIDTTVVSVRDFGARGDGVTNDTAAFQAAVNAAGGHVLRIPAGSYLLGRIVISSPMEVAGDGTGATKLKMRDGNNDALISVRGTSGVSFHDLAIDGNLARQTGGYPHGIQFDRSPDGVVYRVKIDNCEKSAVVAYDGSDRCVVRDSSFSNNENDAEFHMSSYCTATNNDCAGTETEALASYEQPWGPDRTHHNTFSGNRVTGAWAAVNFERSHDNTASGNTITNCQRALWVHDGNAYRTQHYNNSFVGNVVTGATSEAVQLIDEVSGLRFENNKITGGAGTGILVLGNLRRSALTGNTITNNAGGAIWTVGGITWTDCVLARNTIAGTMQLSAGSKVAALGNTMSGSANWPTQTAGTVVDIGQPASAGASQWKCSASGAPGTWSAVTAAPPATPEPAPTTPSAADDPVTRIAGSDRYATAVETSKRNFTSASTVVIATGLDYADALAASPLAGALKAPLLLVPRSYLPGIVRDEIARLGATNAVIAGSDAVVADDVVRALAAAGVSVERIAGPNRYATAAALARKTLATLGQDSADTVFITRGDAYADALGVSSTAYKMGFPVLLVRPDAMPKETLQALKDLHPAHAIIVGGTSAVSTSVERTVRGVCGDVIRLGGANRYATSALVGTYAFDRGWAGVSQMGLASGNRFPDALGGGAAIGGKGGILLLTAPTGMAAETRAFLAKHAADVDDVSIFGGTQALATNVETAIRSACAF